MFVNVVKLIKIKKKILYILFNGHTVQRTSCSTDILFNRHILFNVHI